MTKQIEPGCLCIVLPPTADDPQGFKARDAGKVVRVGNYLGDLDRPVFSPKSWEIDTSIHTNLGNAVHYCPQIRLMRIDGYTPSKSEEAQAPRKVRASKPVEA